MPNQRPTSESFWVDTTEVVTRPALEPGVLGQMVPPPQPEQLAQPVPPSRPANYTEELKAHLAHCNFDGLLTVTGAAASAKRNLRTLLEYISLYNDYDKQAELDTILDTINQVSYTILEERIAHNGQQRVTPVEG